MLSTADVDRLRQALAGFTPNSVLTALGEEAWRALARNETTPGLRVTRGGSRLETLIRLFLLQTAVDRSAVEAAFGELFDTLVNAEILGIEAEQVRALIDIRPYGDESHDWLVASDLTPGLNGQTTRVAPDHVLGIGEASLSLAQLTVREPVGRVLDLGTGCGVQALHLSTHAKQVVATDVNERALKLAELTAALNNIKIDLRNGSMFEPVDGTFDLIVTNPPFVVSPPEGERLVYRETGFVGDDVVKQVVTGAADHLNPGGLCQILAAWIQPEGAAWDERLAEWIEPTGLDAWVIRRESVDVAAYTEMWLTDSGEPRGPRFNERYHRWLDWFAEQGIESMGFGWINLRRSQRTEPYIRIEHYPDAVSEPIWPEFAAWSGRVDALQEGDLWDQRWRVPTEIAEEKIGRPGAPDPFTISLVQTSGLRRRVQLDTVMAGLVQASDGELTAGQLADGLATLLGLDRQALRREYEDTLAGLICDGFLVPA